MRRTIAVPLDVLIRHAFATRLRETNLVPRELRTLDLKQLAEMAYGRASSDYETHNASVIGTRGVRVTARTLHLTRLDLDRRLGSF
jgi:hypothetical protein